jgi:hypothetical protein
VRATRQRENSFAQKLVSMPPVKAMAEMSGCMLFAPLRPRATLALLGIRQETYVQIITCSSALHPVHPAHAGAGGGFDGAMVGGCFRIGR